MPSSSRLLPSSISWGVVALSPYSAGDAIVTNTNNVDHLDSNRGLWLGTWIMQVNLRLMMLLVQSAWKLQFRTNDRKSAMASAKVLKKTQASFYFAAWSGRRNVLLGLRKEPAAVRHSSGSDNGYPHDQLVMEPLIVYEHI